MIVMTVFLDGISDCFYTFLGALIVEFFGG